MDHNAFSTASPGAVVRIPRDPRTGNEIAFVPTPLPPAWEFPHRLWPLLADAKSQLGLLEGIGRSLPNPGILLRPLEDREAIKSSRLEGTYVTATEFLVFEMQPKESTSSDDPANFQLEVLNYRKALHEGAGNPLPISLRLIRQLHSTLMTGVRGRDKTPGEFRKGQVAIGSDHRFVPPPPDQIMACLDALERHIHTTQSNYDGLINCFLVHYQFETIHPFSDGNGRVGRLLLALMLKEFCGLTKPWLYLSDYFEKNRNEYVARLFDVSAIGDWDGWAEFCLHATIEQAKDAILRCERLRLIREDFQNRLQEIGGSVRLTQIVENIFHSPFVRIADLARALKVTYPTAQADVERLVQGRILRELPAVSPKTYYSPAVFAVAYEELE